VRQLVCETLAAHGYRVLEAKSPAEGIELAAGYKDTLHLVLTDVVMPQMNGRQLYEEVAAIHPEIRVLYMSGYADNVIVHHGILEENVKLLQKPFTVHGLTQKVRAALS
jgi:DNA-binding NtrC family response regulator